MSQSKNTISRVKVIGDILRYFLGDDPTTHPLSTRVTAPALTLTLLANDGVHPKNASYTKLYKLVYSVLVSSAYFTRHNDDGPHRPRFSLSDAGLREARRRFDAEVPKLVPKPLHSLPVVHDLFEEASKSSESPVCLLTIAQNLETLTQTLRSTVTSLNSLLQADDRQRQLVALITGAE